MVSYGDNGRGRIIGIGQVGESPSIENVFYVQGLQHNLMSVSQLCDNGYDVLFTKSKCLLREENTSKIVYEGKRVKNLYTVNLNDLTL